MQNDEAGNAARHAHVTCANFSRQGEIIATYNHEVRIMKSCTSTWVSPSCQLCHSIQVCVYVLQRIAPAFHALHSRPLSVRLCSVAPHCTKAQLNVGLERPGICVPCSSVQKMLQRLVIQRSAGNVFDYRKYTCLHLRGQPKTGAAPAPLQRLWPPQPSVPKQATWMKESKRSS